MNEKSVKTDSDFLNFFLKYVSTAREHYALLKNKSHFDNQKENYELFWMAEGSVPDHKNPLGSRHGHQSRNKTDFSHVPI